MKTVVGTFLIQVPDDTNVIGVSIKLSEFFEKQNWKEGISSINQDVKIDDPIWNQFMDANEAKRKYL